MRISLEAIESFAILCKVKSYSKTAKELGRSQPAISNRIRSLETLVGVNLFENGDPNLALTECGRELLDCSDKILQNIHRIRNISDSRGSQPVRIAFLSTIEAFLNPYNLFHTAPDIARSSLFIEMQNYDDLEDQIRFIEGNVAYSVVRDENLPSLRKSWPFTMRWIASSDFPLENFGGSTQLPIVELSEFVRFSNVFYSKLESLGVGYKVVCRAAGINSYLNAISAGLGIGCIGDLFVVQKMKSRNLRFLDKSLGDFGRFHLGRFNVGDLSYDAAKATGIFDKAIDNQNRVMREFLSSI
ncbi:LysR family transcriptional regulator [Ruegeria lacuscaerulensis]|uniref:LysR family transcriptional regulator n=1 Tax=Ruegeria lacuscaerulensis TaxID=55218 RepID=UPI00147D6E15|nr:LysR family transcriptional regulator [Ruegeria lacuscaerulensis]